MSRCHRVAVVGAGVIGLSSAYRLITECKNIQVTLIADQFSPHLTSNVSGGLIELYDTYGTPFELAKKWFLETYDYSINLALGSQSQKAGVSFVRYSSIFGTEGTKSLIAEHDLKDYQNMTAEQLQHYKAQSGFSYMTCIFECKTYLPWLMNKFIYAGGKIMKKKIEDINELFAEFDVVVNCTGLGARELVNDTSLYPIKGQIIKASAPWMLNVKCNENKQGENRESWFMIAGPEMVTIGGTFEKDVETKEIDTKLSAKIWSEAAKMDPTLQNAKKLYDMVGFRPGRHGGIRLEVEKVRNKHVIHNYGHGGVGVTLHWGCAAEVVNSFKQIQTEMKIKSKL